MRWASVWRAGFDMRSQRAPYPQPTAPGGTRVLELLWAEFELALALCGCAAPPT
jgi:hypothetical protein